MAAKPDADDATKAPPKNRKMLIIVLAALLVLGLAGGGAYVYVSKRNAALDEEEEVVKHAAPEGPPTYFPVDNMVVNLADPGGERVAQVGITLQLTDAKASDRVKPYLPAIKNGILMLVSQRKAEELLQKEGKEKLAEDILEEVSRHFAAPTAKDSKKKKAKADSAEANPVVAVLFSSFIVQ